MPRCLGPRYRIKAVTSGAGQTLPRNEQTRTRERQAPDLIYSTTVQPSKHVSHLCALKCLPPTVRVTSQHAPSCCSSRSFSKAARRPPSPRAADCTDDSVRSFCIDRLSLALEIPVPFRAVTIHPPRLRRAGATPAPSCTVVNLLPLSWQLIPKHHIRNDIGLIAWVTCR